MSRTNNILWVHFVFAICKHLSPPSGEEASLKQLRHVSGKLSQVFSHLSLYVTMFTLLLFSYYYEKCFELLRK